MSSPSETQDATVGPSVTGTASGRASPRSFQTSFPSGRPMRAARLARAAINAETSADLEGDYVVLEVAPYMSCLAQPVSPRLTLDTGQPAKSA